MEAVQFENLTNSVGVLVISGPKAREVNLQEFQKMIFQMIILNG